MVYRVKQLWLLLVILMAFPAMGCGLLSEATPTGAPASPTAELATPTSQPELAFVAHEQAELGLSFSYPSSWQLEREDNSVVVASDAGLLTSERFDREGAGSLIVVGGPALFGGATLEDSLQLAVHQFGFTPNDRIVEGPRRTTINGQEAVTATVEGTEDGSSETLVILVTLLRNEERMAFIAGVTLQPMVERYRSTLDSIAQSVVLQPLEGDARLDAMGALRYGDTAEGRIESGSAASWTFIGVQGERVDITVRPLQEQLDVSLDVHDAQGESILENGPVDDSFGLESVRGLTLPASAQYTIVVSGLAQGTGNFEVAIDEAGDLSWVVAIAVGDSVTGVLEADEQNDYLLTDFEAVAINIVVNPVGDLDIVLEVLDGDGAIIFQEDSSYGREQLSFTPDAGEDYVLRVRGFAGAAGEYAISVEEGGVGGAGTTLVTTATLEANDEDGHDFPFWAAQGDGLQAIVVPEGDFDVVVEVWNDDTDEMEERIDASFGREQVDFAAAQSGNYFFRVLGFEGQGGTYTITLSGPPSAIFELLPGDQISGDLGNGASIDYYIRLEADESIMANVVPDGEVDVVVEILDFDEVVLASADNGFAGELEQLSYTAPSTAGESQTFIVRVRNFSGQSGGAFTMTLD